MQLQAYAAQIQQPQLLHGAQHGAQIQQLLYLADLLLSNLPGCKLKVPDGLFGTDRTEY